MAADKTLGGRLIYAARLMRTARAERLLGEGIYSGQDALLRQLAREDGPNMGALAKALGVRPPTITKMVARMETQGLVRRTVSASDSRIGQVFLTEAGSRMLERVAQAWEVAETEAFRDLSDKELRRLKKLLRKVSANLSGKPPAEDE
jgi:DNA-binding MarR family transcriptional regulator